MDTNAFLDFETDTETYTHEITGDDVEYIAMTLEDWLWNAMEEAGVEVYEIETFRTDGNTFQITAFEDYGEIIGRGTIQTDEF